MIESAAAQYGPVTSGVLRSTMRVPEVTDEGAKAFGEATTRLAASNGTISIWLDDENVSMATVNAAITDGEAIITSSASNPSRRMPWSRWPAGINSGALPLPSRWTATPPSAPAWARNSLSAMVLAGVIASRH